MSVAFKLAGRQARRQRLRTVAIVATLALPIAVVGSVDIVVRSTHLSDIAQLDRRMGSAQALVSWSGQGTAIQQTPDGSVIAAAPTPGQTAPTYNAFQPSPAALPAGVVPAGATAYRQLEGGVYLVSAKADTDTTLYAEDLTAPPFRSLVAVTSGRPASGMGQIDLTSRLAADLGTRIGAVLQAAGYPGGLRVVGIVRDRYGPRDVAAYVAPGGIDSASAANSGGASSLWFLSTPNPVTWAEIAPFNAHGFVVASRYGLAHPPPVGQVPVVPNQGIVGGVPHRISDHVTDAVIAAMALLEVILLTGPAFAVGARRRRFELAMVSATGGTRRQLVTLVVVEGLVMGAVAAVAGVGIGVAGGTAALAGFPHFTNRVPGPVQIPVLDLAGLAVLAVVTGLLAAVVPALGASRRITASAIRGREDHPRLSVAPALFGLAALTAAVILAVVERDEQSYSGPPVLLVSAAALGEIGFALVAPGLLSLLGRFSRRLPLWSRLALRDASRNRSAAAPAVAAIVAVVAATSALLVYGSSAVARDRLTYQPSAMVGDATAYTDSSNSGQSGQAVAAVRADLPGATVLDLRGVVCESAQATCRQVTAVPPEEASCPTISFGSSGLYAQSSGSQCAAFPIEGTYLVDGGATTGSLVGGAAGAEAQRALEGGEVVVFSPSLQSGGRVTLEMGPGGPSKVSVPAVVVDNPTLALLFPAVLPPAVAQHLDLPVGAEEIYVKGAARLPGAELRRAATTLVGLGMVGLDVETGFHDHTSPILLAVALGDLLLTLGAAVAATALIAIDDRADLLTLAAIGAAPRARRRLAMARAALICSVGAVFGTLAGLLPGIGLVSRLSHLIVQPPGPNTGPYYAVPGYPLSIPWADMAIIAVAAPVVAVLVAGLVTRARLPIERRRPG